MDNEKFYGKYKMTGARFEEILESLCGLAEGSDSKVDGRNVPSSFSLGFGAGDAAMVHNIEMPLCRCHCHLSDMWLCVSRIPLCTGSFEFALLLS